MSEIAHYLFDIDGTLTEPRRGMDSSFAISFLSWMKNKSVFLVAGSDIHKIHQQVPASVTGRCAGIFCSMGNEFWSNGDVVYRKEWLSGVKLLDELREIRKNSPYTNKKGDWLERRRGMINFSIAGRSSNLKERKKYYSWDEENKERVNIVKRLSKKYKNLDFRIGGQISIDINPVGNNKSQASKWVRENLGGKIYFFGDSCQLYGNDYDIYLDVKNNDGEANWVKSPASTLELLNRGE